MKVWIGFRLEGKLIQEWIALVEHQEDWGRGVQAAIDEYVHSTGNSMWNVVISFDQLDPEKVAKTKPSRSKRKSKPRAGLQDR